MPSLEEGNRPVQMGGQWHFKTTLLPHSGVLTQRCKFEDFEGKPLYDQWALETKGDCRSKKIVKYLHGDVSWSPRIQPTIETLHFPCNHRLWMKYSVKCLQFTYDLDQSVDMANISHQISSYFISIQCLVLSRMQIITSSFNKLLSILKLYLKMHLP